MSAQQSQPQNPAPKLSQQPGIDPKIRLSQQLLEKDLEIIEAEKNLKLLKKDASSLEQRLVEQMLESGLVRFETEGGKKISIKQKTFTNFLVAYRAEVMNWLREIDRADAIKTDVNRGSFRKIVREFMDEGAKEVPSFITIHIENQIDIKDSKNKSLRRPREKKEEYE